LRISFIIFFFYCNPRPLSRISVERHDFCTISSGGGGCISRFRKRYCMSAKHKERHRPPPQRTTGPPISTTLKQPVACSTVRYPIQLKKISSLHSKDPIHTHVSIHNQSRGDIYSTSESPFTFQAGVNWGCW
jgi:hypothetical protein